MDLLDLLKARHSTPARQLGEPGPSPQQLDRLLGAAIRVPDHGKLQPFRLLLLQGEARVRFGAELAALHLRKEPDLPASVSEKDRTRFA
ncbi:MAG: nitroreductase family protein, partial [Rudaea sp.]